MATTEGKAKQFIKRVEDAASDAMGALQIDPSDISMSLHVEVKTAVRSDFPKEG